MYSHILNINTSEEWTRHLKPKRHNCKGNSPYNNFLHRWFILVNNSNLCRASSSRITIQHAGRSVRSSLKEKNFKENDSFSSMCGRPISRKSLYSSGEIRTRMLLGSDTMYLYYIFRNYRNNVLLSQSNICGMCIRKP